MRGSAAQFFKLIPGVPRLVTSLLSLLLPVFAVFVASFPVFSAVLLRCDVPVVAPSFCFSRVFRFCCPVAFFRLRRPVAPVRSLLRFRIWRSAPSSRRAAGAIRSTCAQLTPFFVWGELREKRAVARNFASLRGIRVRDQGCEFGQDCRSDRLAGGVRDRVLVEATV